jgi:hypothetical protein
MLYVPAIHFPFFHSDVGVIELLNRIVVFFWDRDGIETRTEFLAAEEQSLVIPWITLLTDRNLVITTTDRAGETTISSTRILISSNCRRQGGRSWRRYRGPRQLRHRRQ